MSIQGQTKTNAVVNMTSNLTLESLGALFEEEFQNMAEENGIELYPTLKHPSVLIINIVVSIILTLGGATTCHLATAALERSNYDILLYKTALWLAKYTTIFHVTYIGSITAR